jgi:hypothetical protein
MKERILGRIPRLLNDQIGRALDWGGGVRLCFAGRLIVQLGQ